jgi:endonuclease/exonuclease/phosphatase family protein
MTARRLLAVLLGVVALLLTMLVPASASPGPQTRTIADVGDALTGPTLAVATYNVRAASPDAGTLADLRALLAQADALVLQEVAGAGKKAAISRVQAETGAKVLYSPGQAAEAIIWHPTKLVLQAKGAVVLSEPTAVGNPSVTIPRKYLTWGRFQLLSPLTSSQVGVVHLVARPHVDRRRAALLKLEVANLARRCVDFKRPLVGGDFNVDYDDPWLDPLRNIGMLNDHEALGWLPTFYNASDGAPRSFDQ